MTGETETKSAYASRAAELRGEFDRAFAAPPAAAAEELESVLTFGVAGDRFAVRLLEVGGIARTEKIAPVPNSTRALLGMAGIRGELLSVYSLSALLDYSSDAEVKWLLLCGESPRAGLGVSEFYGCFKVPKTAFCAAADADAPDRAWSREVVLVESVAHTVVSIAWLLKSIREAKKSEGE